MHTASTRSAFKVDRFHASTHKCSPALRDFAPVEFDNTSVVEQFNRVLRRIEPSLRSMMPFHAMQLLRLFVIFHNWAVVRRMVKSAEPAAVAAAEGGAGGAGVEVHDPSGDGEGDWAGEDD